MAKDKKNVWIVGANGGLGLGLTQQILAQGHQVTASSRRPSTALQQLEKSYSGNITTVIGDLSQQDSDLSSQLTAIFERYGRPDWTINASGLLHSNCHGDSQNISQSSKQSYMPEKRLSQITPTFLADNIEANTYTSIAIAQYLDSLYKRDTPFSFLCLSAMVGSINDNRSGGWYSYRMSKAALNMFVKTLSIEWQRRFPHACIAAIHPGTTDTTLSGPFQQNITGDKLYTPELSAKRIYHVLSTLTPKDSGHFFHWDGSQLDW